MKILFLAHRLPYPPNKGDKIRSSWELRVLSKQNEVDLVCFYDSREDAKYLDGARNQCRYLYAERLPWLRSRFRALLSFLVGRPLSLGYFHSSSLSHRVQELTQREQYKAIFCFCSPMAEYAKGIQGIPRLLDMVDADSAKWEQYGRSAGWPFSWLWRQEARRLALYEEKMASEFDSTFLCTDAETSELRQRCPGAMVETLAHPIDTDYFDPERVPVPSEVGALQPYVVFTGWMDYFPNADAVEYFSSEILPLLRRELPDLRFVIAGGNPTSSVRGLAKRPGVHFTGYVPDLRPYLRGAMAAVAPFRIARGIQNKVLEALSMGLPVALTERAAVGVPEELRPLLMIEDDPHEFAARLIERLRAPVSVRSVELRQAVQRLFNSSALEVRLHDLLTRTVKKEKGIRATTTAWSALVPSTSVTNQS